MKNYIKSNVCQIGNLTCFGCCGRNYKTRKEVVDRIIKNTKEYEEHIEKGKQLSEFINRYNDVHHSGVCHNVILKHNKVFCPAHPELNKGNDIRIGYCDIHYLCKAAFCYKQWSDDKKKKFVEFIKNKNLDWFEFSIGMDNDSLLKEFEGD